MAVYFVGKQRGPIQWKLLSIPKTGMKEVYFFHVLLSMKEIAFFFRYVIAGFHPAPAPFQDHNPNKEKSNQH